MRAQVFACLIFCAPLAPNAAYAANVNERLKGHKTNVCLRVMRETIIGQRIASVRDANNGTTIASLTGFKNMELRQPQNERNDYKRILVDSRSARKKDLAKVAAQINGIASWPERHTKEDDVLYTRVLRGSQIDEFMKAYDHLSEEDAAAIASGYQSGVMIKTLIPTVLVAAASVAAGFKWPEAMHGANVSWVAVAMHFFKKYPGKNNNYLSFMTALQAQRNSNEGRVNNGWLYYSEKSEASRANMNMSRIDTEQMKADAGPDELEALNMMDGLNSLFTRADYVSAEAHFYLNLVAAMSGNEKVNCPVMADFLLRRGATREEDELVVSFRSRMTKPEASEPAPDPNSEKKESENWAGEALPTEN